MSPRTTGILLLVAAALGAFVWFYEIEGAAERKSTEEAEKRLFAGLEADDVLRVSLTTADGVAVSAERRNGGWQILSPLVFPGDAATFDDIAAALAALAAEATFDSPQAAPVYGLDNPGRELRFGGAAQEWVLRTGDETPMGESQYAQVGGADAVHTVPTWRTRNLSPEFLALRDKRVLAFDRDAVVRVVAAWPGGRVALDREGDAWRVAAPYDGPADAETLRGLLSDLASLRAAGFVDDPLPDAETGLADPAFRVELGLAPESAEGEARVLVLSVGDATAGDERLVRSGGASLYRVAADRFARLPRDVSAYRFRGLAGFPVDAARDIEIAFAGEGEAGVRLRATRSDGGWTSSPEAVDPAKLARLVEELDGLTAETILAEQVGPDELAGLGLAPPAAAFVVRDADGTVLADVRLGRFQGAAGMVAQTGGNPQVFRLDSDAAEHLPVNLDAFRNRFLVVEEPDPELDAFIEGLDAQP